jgi:hypothetical protein
MRPQRRVYGEVVGVSEMAGLGAALRKEIGEQGAALRKESATETATLRKEISDLGTALRAIGRVSMAGFER